MCLKQRRRKLEGPLAQLVEQYTFNVRVAGSNPARLTIYIKSCPHRLAWPRTPPFHGGDAGSNPAGDAISPSEFFVSLSLSLSLSLSKNPLLIYNHALLNLIFFEAMVWREHRLQYGFRPIQRMVKVSSCSPEPSIIA
jgi:hypothetical protein